MDENLLIGVAIGAGLAGFVLVVYAAARAGGLHRLSWGLSVAGRAGMEPAFEAAVNKLLGEPPAPVPITPSLPPKPSGEPLRVLALLQAEARLVDFLMEDITAAGDAQIGAAVRDIHAKAQAALKQHMTLAPVMAEAEGERVTVPAGFDPSAIRVVGNITGHPPFSGELQHPGWKVTELKLPTAPQGQDPFVIQPAEVQV